jgi:hypothetical protein
MSVTGLIRAISVLAALLVLWGAFALFRGSIGDAARGLTLPRLTAAEVDRVAIVQGGDTVLLARSGGGWRVNGYAADGTQLDQLFRALADTGTSSELVARSAASHGRLGVDGAGRRAVFMGGGDTLLALVVGGQGRAFQTAYLRLAGDDEVFLYRGALPGILSRALDTWRDRSIARIPADSVEAVTIARAGREAVLRRTANGWTVDGRPADTAAVGRLLRALGDLSAIGFATAAEADSLDFGRPWRRLSVHGRGGEPLLALDMDSTLAGYWMRRADQGDVFRVDFWRLDQLTPAADVLRDAGR